LPQNHNLTNPDNEDEASETQKQTVRAIASSPSDKASPQNTQTMEKRLHQEQTRQIPIVKESDEEPTGCCLSTG
jgi:hypothetical protein